MNPWLDELKARAARIDALDPSARDAALKDLQRRPPDPVRPTDPDLDAQQAKALIVDHVRLLEIARLRADPGARAAALAAMCDRAGRRVCVISGAGISVDAGFPTFRGAGGEGLWEQVDPMELASIEGFRRDPERTLRWYCWRRSLGFGAVPTLAHAVIAAAQSAHPGRWAGVHTQNVDGLHEAAGSTGVNRIHGSIWCWRDRSTHELCFDPSDDYADVPTDAAGRPSVRPGVVMFGDFAPVGVYERAIGEISRSDVAMVVGTSAQVTTLWPLLHAARRAGALLVDVNPEPSPVVTELDGLSLPLPSGVGVPLALEALALIDPAVTDSLASTPRRPLRDALPALGAELLADA